MGSDCICRLGIILPNAVNDYRHVNAKKGWPGFCLLISRMKEKNIYLLEDDPDIQELISYILTRDGYKVFAFEKVQDFNKQVQKALPDLFIMDVSLPDGNGLEVSKQLVIQTGTAMPPILLMSADYYNEPGAFSAGAKSFMRKPFNIADLLGRVEALLAA
jgi:two-component system, OmpR family, phosphate regulon response regulator PhoB